jgi:phage baseplate assembly protein W
MALAPDVELYGSGPSYPLRASSRGLPDLVVAEGEEAVASSFRFLLRTEQRELLHDPALGLAFQRFKHNAMDNRLRREIFSAINGSLLSAEPRVENVSAEVGFPVQGTRADISIAYDLITRQVDNNGVLNPSVGGEDILNITEE